MELFLSLRFICLEDGGLACELSIKFLTGMSSGGDSVQEVTGQSFVNFQQICFDFEYEH